MSENEQKVGIIYTLSAYTLWGILPLYWKLVQEVPAGEILAHRIIWSFLFMMAIVFVTKNGKAFLHEAIHLIQHKKRLVGITLASITISINWLTYIWAVNANHVVEVSLGYYINPLVSILLGMVILKERLTPWQIVSFLLAMIGVMNLIIHFHQVPWIALILALSFGAYGLLKKQIQLSSMFGLTIETLMITPIAILYITQSNLAGSGSFTISPLVTSLLVGAGVATAIPLLFFASGARRIPLSMVGFLQYVAPTIMLLLGVFLYNEPFTKTHFISFTFIWAALFLYSLSRTKWFVHIEHKLFPNRKAQAPG
ncbi:EamA family transporter RarD [Pontibacillus yanchengensis]|uniref:EamA family transporter RarD n=2 Tax=Pontibacillus yanchengensis TaxID=462910 RepID=A0ACC7VIF5_9BACI|nr:EamA family transporter RarD [Pontibacillus yanchengensis]MYL36009.1 EamA family transporter RarD [Pontibacillus yanchengensis]MYL54405.1 EamA family transporter RarD [Pontibacillus yanchengensis]